MKMQYAPIALFTYNRADHTKQAVESLLKNAEAKYSDLFIFSDGPKNEKAAEGVKKNREYIKTLKDGNGNVNGNFRSVNIIEREKNWGLANSLIAGITEIVNKYGRVIVVEDDLILSPYFLRYVNEALEKYEEEEKVGAIAAYVPTTDTSLPETFFLYHFHCWGWATWKRAWGLLETDSRVLLRKLRFKKNDFDVDGSAGAYGNLYCQKVGLIDSWWVRFYASLFIAKKLILYPHHSLVTNNGQDGTGTHVGNGVVISDNIHFVSKPINIKDIEIKESKQGRNAFKEAFNAKRPIESRFKLKINGIISFIRRLLFIDCI